MEPTDNILVLAYLNTHGQTGLNLSKQLQIEEFLNSNKIDILHLQETFIDDDTFSQCSYINSNFIIIHNNSNNMYGTASLVKSTLPTENIILHESGRIILFNICGITFGNIYLPSGTDGQSRASRENLCGDTLPTLLINSRSEGVIGGDWNNIVSKDDCTRYPEAKMSPCLKRIVNTFSWKDAFRILHPDDQVFSRYYSNDRSGSGATRIDRCYIYGNLHVRTASYTAIAFSDHFSHIVTLSLPSPLAIQLSPKSRPLFKTRPDIVRDKVFKARLKDCMEEWNQARLYGIPTLAWWDILVKPGIRKLAIERTKEVNKERRLYLNLLILRQSYLSRKVRNGEPGSLAALREIHLRIEHWFSTEAEKIKHQARVDDVQESEKVRIFHHEIHQKHVKMSTILKLETSTGLLVGHRACSNFLQNEVADLLQHPAVLDAAAQQVLLEEIDKVFTDSDNEMITSPPSKEEVQESVRTSNTKAAPGTDGLTSLVYKEHFDILGDALTEVAQAVHSGQQPTKSQRTSLMIFTSKPGKTSSIKPKDKRRISLLNSDFKVLTGLEVARFRKVLAHTLCPEQLAEAGDRRISFGICHARDAIYAAGMRKAGCGLADNDFQAAFDYLCLDWVRKVLQKKGLAKEALDRFTNLYKEGLTIPVINNKPGSILVNNRLSLRQGDRPSGLWFCFGIDPLLVYLAKRLTGILIHSLPVLGPAPQDQPCQLPALETRYKVLGYLDDCKPAITSMEEFLLVDRACRLFELSSGCKLHRDPASNKCKFLALGRWKGTLEQDYIPLPYLKLTDHLDFLGCKLFANYGATRRENGEILKNNVKKQINSWKAGKFMPLTLRPWSINTYCLSKLWYRTACIDLRVGDSSAIASSIKSWLYQDLLIKPQEMMMYREVVQGGLGVYNVKMRAMAMLLHTFLTQAISPFYKSNIYYTTLYRWHVLEERDLPNPGCPPYYSLTFFSIIKDVKDNTPLNVAHLSVKQWYRLLMEKGVTHTCDDPSSPPVLLPSKVELEHPQVDLDASYLLSRKYGLAPEQKQFLFKLLQSLLPTRERLARLGKVQTPACQFCDCGNANNVHLLLCSQGAEVSQPLVRCLATHSENSNPEDLVLLNIPTSESLQLPVVWLLSTCLMYIWEERVAGRTARLVNCQAELKARLLVLKHTRWKHYILHNSAVLLEEMINLHF